MHKQNPLQLSVAQKQRISVPYLGLLCSRSSARVPVLKVKVNRVFTKRNKTRSELLRRDDNLQSERCNLEWTCALNRVSSGHGSQPSSCSFDS